MIIDKVKPYKTDDDRRRQMELEEQAQALEATLTDDMPESEFAPIMEQLQKYATEIQKIDGEVENRYIKALSREMITIDAQEIIEALEIEDFQRYSEIRKQELSKFKNDAALAPLKKWSEESYRNAYYYIMFFLRVQLNALANDEERTARIKAAIKEKAAEWYPASATEAIKEESPAGIIQLQSTGTPKYFISPNTLLSNALRAIDGKGEVFGAGPLDLPVLNIGTEKEITIFVNASIENITIEGKPYTEYDRAVQDTVVTLYADRIKNGLPPIFDADMIYRTMAHKTNADKVSKQQRAAITKSIEKQQKNLYVEADMTSELKAKNILEKITVDGEPATSFKIKGFLLSATEIEVKAGGKKKTAYLFNEPVLYRYAQINNKQIITVPGKVLDIREIETRNGDTKITDLSISNTEERISVKSYLLRRVELIRKDEAAALDSYRQYKKRRKKDDDQPIKEIADFRNPKISRVILFDSIFEAAEITAKNRKTELRDYTLKVLDYWQALGRIKGYTTRKKGKTIDAVDIEP